MRWNRMKTKRHFSCNNCSKFAPSKKKGRSSTSSGKSTPRSQRNDHVVAESVRDGLDRIAGEEMARLERQKVEAERKADELAAKKLEEEKRLDAEEQRIKRIIQRMSYDKEEALPVEGWGFVFLLWIIMACLFYYDYRMWVWWVTSYFVIAFTDCITKYFSEKVSPFYYMLFTLFFLRRPTMTVRVSTGKMTRVDFDQRTDRLAVGNMKHMNPLVTELLINRSYGLFTFRSHVIYVSHEVIAQLSDADIVIGHTDDEVRRLMETKARYLYSINIDRFSMYENKNIYNNSVQVAFDLYRNAEDEAATAWGLSGRLLW